MITILCVDDETGILSILERTLINEADIILTTPKPVDAIEIVKNKKIDLAILDLKMPGMDGLTLLHKLKEISTNTSYLLLTAYGDKSSIQSALRIGIDDFIDKPFDSQYLKKKIKTILEKKQYEYLMNEVIELLIKNFSQINPDNFSQMSYEEKSKTFNAILEVAKLKLFKKQNSN